MIEPQDSYNSNVYDDLQAPDPCDRFWGPWATFGLGIAITVISLIVQVIIAVIFIAAELSPVLGNGFEGMNYLDIMEEIDAGLLVSLSIIISAIVCTSLIYVFVKAKRGAPFKEYIGFRRISIKTTAVILSISIGYIVLSFLVTWALDISQETDVMTEAFATSVWPVLFWLAAVVFAPVFEEVFFRGFLFEGFRYSKLGVGGAIILTSLVWAGFHLQYALFQIATIFVLGVIFGVVRYRTNSVWAPMIMHIFHNFIAMLLMAGEFGV